MTAEEFFHDFRQELLASAEANGSFQLTEFMEAVANELIETGFGGKVTEKLRAGMARIRMAGKPVSYCSAVAEVRLGENFEPADGVTELITRIEGALVMAQKKGGNRTVISKFSS